MQMKFLIVGLVLAALIIGSIWWWQRPVQPAAVESQPPPITSPEVAVPEPEPLLEPEPPPEPVEPPLPSLNESDALVRESLEALTGQGRYGQVWRTWLALDDLVRRFAVIIENATRGQYPRRQLVFLDPAGPFKVLKRDGQIYIDPASYDRYDPLVDTLLTIPPQQAARQLQRLEPLLALAMGELGVRDTHPLDDIQRAIDGVLQTPLLEGQVEVLQPKVLYQYANPELEALPELSKQLLRMGPGNLLRIQAYLRDLQAALQVSGELQLTGE